MFRRAARQEGRQGEPGSSPTHAAVFSFHHLPDFISNIHQDPPRASYMVVHTFNASIQETEAGGSLSVSGQHSEFQTTRAPQRHPVSQNKQASKQTNTKQTKQVPLRDGYCLESHQDSHE